MFIGSFFLFLTTKQLVLLIVVTLWTVHANCLAIKVVTAQELLQRVIEAKMVK